MKTYNLGFISDSDIYEHVKETVLKYRFKINLSEFNSNIIDPIKLTFDAKVYKRDIEEVLEGEIIRQLDKTNTNHIGYFHQNIFKYVGNGWVVPKEGYDVVNQEKLIYVEVKNKHNTMNDSSSKNTFIKMQSTVLKEPSATCLLVEVIATNSQDIPWKVKIDGASITDQRIRRVSIDKFYKMATGDNLAFKKLCAVLPTIIEDVVSQVELRKTLNTVVSELKATSENLLKSIYLLAFRKYEGFNDFNF
jgi:hypothetical protein